MCSVVFGHLGPCPRGGLFLFGENMKPNPMLCPVCESEMRRVDIPRFQVGVCVSCATTGQLLPDGTVRPIDNLLQASALDDDRLRAAVSKPQVASVPNFIELVERSSTVVQMEIAELTGSLRMLLAQVENRIDSCLSVFAGLDLASDQAADGLRALREAREMVSTLPRKSRGLRSDDAV